MLANDSWVENWLRSWQQQRWGWGALCSWVSTNIRSSLPQTHFQATRAGPFPPPLAAHWLTPDSQWRFKCSTKIISGTARAPGTSSSSIEQLKGMSLLVKAWQNVVHWRREWQTTTVFLPWEPHEQYEKAKRCNTERWTSQVSRCTGEEQRISYGKNEGVEWEITPNCGCIWWWKSSPML